MIEVGSLCTVVKSCMADLFLNLFFFFFFTIFHHAVHKTQRADHWARATPFTVFLLTVVNLSFFPREIGYSGDENARKKPLSEFPRGKSESHAETDLGKVPQDPRPLIRTPFPHPPFTLRIRH